VPGSCRSRPAHDGSYPSLSVTADQHGMADAQIPETLQWNEDRPLRLRVLAVVDDPSETRWCQRW
jgi:hypothetical protein